MKGMAYREKSRRNICCLLITYYKFPLFYILHLEDHVVGLVVSCEGESSTQVCLKHGGSLKRLQQSSIDLLLVSLALIRNDCSLRCISSEELLLISGSNTRKVGVGN